MFLPYLFRYEAKNNTARATQKKVPFFSPLIPSCLHAPITTPSNRVSSASWEITKRGGTFPSFWGSCRYGLTINVQGVGRSILIWVDLLRPIGRVRLGRVWPLH